PDEGVVGGRGGGNGELDIGVPAVTGGRDVHGGDGDQRARSGQRDRPGPGPGGEPGGGGARRGGGGGGTGGGARGGGAVRRGPRGSPSPAASTTASCSPAPVWNQGRASSTRRRCARRACSIRLAAGWLRCQLKPGTTPRTTGAGGRAVDSRSSASWVCASWNA